MQNRSLKKITGHIVGYLIGILILILLAVAMYFVGDNWSVYFIVFGAGIAVFSIMIIKNLIKYRYTKVDKDSDRIFKASFIGFKQKRMLRQPVLAIEVNYINENGEQTKGISDFLFSLKDIEELKQLPHISIAHKSNGVIIIMD